MDITLVHGAPCAGKNEYVQGKMQEGDVIIDADLLAQALGSPDSHNHPGHIKSLGMKLRDVAIREASRSTYRTWVISASPRATQTIPHTSSLHLDPGMDVCLERAKTRPSWTKEAIRDYYDKLEIPEPSRFAKVQWLEVDMTLVYGTVTNVSGQPVPNARVYAALSSAGVSGDTIISTRRNVRANRYGYWEMDIIPNSSIEPAGTYYIVRHLNAKMFIVVPDTEDNVSVNSIISAVPNNPLSTSTYVNDIDGHYGSISAATMTSIVGGGGGGGGGVTSVDARVGAVTLNDRYATLSHNHDGTYSPLSHSHTYPVTSVNGQTGDVVIEGSGGSSSVISVDGRDGEVTLSDRYAALVHNHNSLYSGITHNHNASYASISHNHNADYLQLTDDYVATVDGNTGAIDLTGTYVQIGQETVTSVNGQTGDVVISGGGGGAVDSVDGRTGTVTLDDLYSGVSHNHDSSYSAISHNHNSSYAPLVHDHDASYSAIGHNHDSAYSATGHTHSYPVTSVDGLTGAVSLSSTYAASGHNHSGVYSVTSHNHDSAYSATGHTHSYPVTSVDGLTGAVSLSSTYAASAHNHNASYATTGHTHSELSAGAWSNATMTTNVGGTLQYRSEPAYGVVRLRTSARIYSISGTFSAGSTLATLPVGARPASEFKVICYQGAEPTQNAIIIKVATSGTVTIVNSISLTGTQSSGIIIDHSFSTS